jgi:hypothetical protein
MTKTFKQFSESVLQASLYDRPAAEGLKKLHNALKDKGFKYQGTTQQSATFDRHYQKGDDHIHIGGWHGLKHYGGGKQIHYMTHSTDTFKNRTIAGDILKGHLMSPDQHKDAIAKMHAYVQKL